jgi:proton-dependent oligopeptide transporter, POT family
MAGAVIGYGWLHATLERWFGPLSVQAMSSHIYGMYTGLLYVTPLLGGLLADRVLGKRRTVLLGGVLMAIGHFLMAFGAWFFLALLCIIIGNGCFKPNVSAQVGDLYDRTDNRRDSAFSIFYVGINLGAFVAPAICGTLGEVYGWHYGFFAAGVGMLIGLAVFHFGRRHLAPDILPSRARLGGALIPITRSDGRAMAVLCIIALVLTFFWAGYEQSGNAVVLWVRDFTNRSFFGLFDIKVTWFQGIAPFLIFALTPILLVIWAHLAREGREPGPVAKMTLGCFLGGAAYFVLGAAALMGGADAKVSWLWSICYFTLLTMAELLVSPVALSVFSRVAPARVASMMMGVWFLSGALGNYFAGIIGSYWEKLPKPVFWSGLALLCCATGIVLLALKPTIDSMIAGKVPGAQRAAAAS